MIIFHPLKLTFVKTKKVGGTSFEIALSSLCDEYSVITPISPKDEKLRASIGCKTAQNYRNTVWTGKDAEGWVANGSFYNHISATEAHPLIPTSVWESYKKITIFRGPFDIAMSQYFWCGGPSLGLTSLQFLEENRALLTQNCKIAPLQGEAQLDLYLRYEDLAEDISNLEIPGLLELFQALRPKGDARPKHGASINVIYDAFPDAAKLIAEDCKDIIDAFGYRNPVAKAA